MSIFPSNHRWSGAGNAGAVVLLAWALCGCGNSSLKTARPEAGLDIPVGWSGGDPGTSTVDANGGMTSIPDAPGAGSGGQGGTLTTMTTTGGAPGRDAAPEVASGGGGVVAGTGGMGGTGGLVTTGGTTSKGGQTGTGGVTATGGRTATGGTTSKGGQTGTGGVVATGGRTATGGTAGIATGGVIGLDGGIDGGGGTGAVALALQPLAKAFCAAARTCCKRDGFYAMDLADCENKLPSHLQPYPLLEQGLVTIDPTRLAACVSAYESAATTCAVAEVDAACHGLWIGTGAEGQSCGGIASFGAFECQLMNGAGACYWQAAEHYPDRTGVCLALPRGKAGDPCGKSCGKNQDCAVDLVGGSAPFPVMCFEEDGLYCAVTANPPVCKPYSRVGDPCSYDFGSCGRGNYCDWNDHVCKVAAKLGESCMVASCVDGTVCTTGSQCIAETLASSDVCMGTPSVP